MLFPTHLLVAYAVGKRWDLPPYWAVAGAALPDVVDKPLAMVGLTELYHTVGHSLLLLLGLSIVNVVSRTGLALWFGWASHLFLDGFQMALNGRPADVLSFGWPFLEHVPEVQLGPVEFLFHYAGTPSFYVEVAMWIALAYVLVVDRRAGEESP